MEWFSGYCDADGSISKNGKNQSLQISSINKNFLKNIKLMLQTCGIGSIISLNMNDSNPCWSGTNTILVGFIVTLYWLLTCVSPGPVQYL